MKTTFEIPDALYRQIKARAALKGQSVKDFLVEAVRAKLANDHQRTRGKSKAKTGWQAAFGAADPDDVAEVQRIIDEEFSKIDPDDWK